MLVWADLRGGKTHRLSVLGAVQQPLSPASLHPRAARGSSARTRNPLLLAHPTPLPPCSGGVSGFRHVRCLSAARSLLSNCFAAPSRMWAWRGGCARGRMNSRSVFREGMGEARRGERSENREEEGERMLPCLFSDLYWLNCAGLAKSGAELPSPPLSSRQALVFGAECFNSLQLQPAPN